MYWPWPPRPVSLAVSSPAPQRSPGDGVMSLSTGHRGTAAALAGALLLGVLVLAGCEAGHAVTKIPHPVAGPPLGASRYTVASTPVPGGKGALDAFVARLQAGAATPFEVKYVSWGKV